MRAPEPPGVELLDLVRGWGVPLEEVTPLGHEGRAGGGSRRQGCYGHKALADILNIGQADVRKLLRGQLPPGRALELQAQMLKAGLPL